MERAPDEHYMRLALEEADSAAAAGEVPVGCVVVHGGTVIARAHNLRESLRDPTAHAEILALQQAAQILGQWRLEGVTVYCTVEPCCMCAGALVNARVARLVYGVSDPKSGACGTVFDVPAEPRLNHRLEVRGGVLAEEALEVLQRFFEPRRR
ncbi:MAG: tRNA adenosine(34) deaminase TadA [Planctomycetota bacterium]|jgi:tRNA(adenine34) deaminase